jgi:hypothetical protein
MAVKPDITLNVNSVISVTDARQLTEYGVGEKETKVRVKVSANTRPMT